MWHHQLWEFSGVQGDRSFFGDLGKMEIGQTTTAEQLHKQGYNWWCICLCCTPRWQLKRNKITWKALMKKSSVPLQLQIGFCLLLCQSFHFCPASSTACVLHCWLLLLKTDCLFFLLPAGLSEEKEELITSVIRKEPIWSGELMSTKPNKPSTFKFLHQSYLYGSCTPLLY